MPNTHAQQFMEALHRLEEQNDVQGMVELFDDAAELSNPTAPSPHHGRDGARHFWQAYRGAFQEIHSDFRNVADADGVALLEWSSHGRAIDGSPVEYDGVSVVEFDDGKVRRFRAYFDPNALKRAIAG